MALAQSSWNKVLPLLTQNLLCSLQICSFTSLVLTLGPVYDLDWYGMCFAMAFQPREKPSQRITDVHKVLWQSTWYLLGNLYRLYQQNDSAASMSFQWEALRGCLYEEAPLLPVQKHHSLHSRLL